MQNNELWEGNANLRRKHLDALLDTNQGIINVEVNSEDYIKERNFAFLSKAYANHTLRGEEYDTKIQFIQINFSYEIRDSEYYRVYHIQDDKQKDYISNFTIYEFNMDKYVKLWYTHDKQKIGENKYLIMMNLPKEELEKFSKEDKVVSKYMDKLNRINEDPAFLNLIDYEQDNRMWMNTMKRRAEEAGLKEGIEKGIKQGIEKGIKQGIEQGFREGSNTKAFDIAKKLLKIGTDIEIVSQVTGISVEKLQSI